MITTACTIPPAILQSFSPTLLTHPFNRVPSERLLEEFKYIKWIFNKKTKSGWRSKEKEEGLKIIEELERTYEWIKAKEKELESKTTHKTKEPFYYVAGLSKKDSTLCKGFEYKRIPIPAKRAWRNNKVQKAKRR